MPLKIKLKPQEEVILGGALLANGEHPAELTICNRVPILRGKDIMREEAANTPVRRIYFLLQAMYLEQARTPRHYQAFLSQVKDLLAAAPSMVEGLYTVSEAVLDEDFYRALRSAKKLMQHEAELLAKVA